MKTTLNASGMADIAFLLLIFFLVATTFLNEKGVKATLPPYYEGPPGKLPDHQVMDIKINMNDEVMIEGKIVDIEAVQQEIINFINGPVHLPSFSQDAVISLQHDAKTSYKAYLNIYRIIKKAYEVMRSRLAQHLFNQEFDELSVKDKNVIIQQLPIKISEAEPFVAMK